MNEELCTIHSGTSPKPKGQRHPLDSIISRLPKNYSGKGRNKCAYCAYLAGIDETIKAVEKALEITKFPKEDYAVPNRVLQNRTHMVQAIKHLLDQFDFKPAFEDYLGKLADKDHPDWDDQREDDQREEWIQKHL